MLYKKYYIISYQKLKSQFLPYSIVNTQLDFFKDLKKKISFCILLKMLYNLNKIYSVRNFSLVYLVQVPNGTPNVLNPPKFNFMFSFNINLAHLRILKTFILLLLKKHLYYLHFNNNMFKKLFLHLYLFIYLFNFLFNFFFPLQKIILLKIDFATNKKYNY